MSPHGHSGGTEARPRHRRVAACPLRAEPRARGALHDDVGARERAALHAFERRDRLRPRPGVPGRVPVHARRVSLHVPRQALDDAPVRRLRHRRGDERALPLPARPRADGPVDGLRHADPDGLRLRPPEVARRGRARGSRDRLARGHGAALRGDPARRGLDLDDDQRAGGDAPRLLHLRRRAAGRSPGPFARDDPDGHPQGVHRPEGVDLPARALDAALRGHDRVLRAARPALAPGLDLGLPHPRGRLDGRPGARLHPGRRLRLRGGGHRARPRRGRLRAAALLLLQRAHRLLRGGREVPCRAPHLGEGAARALRGQEPSLVAHALPRSDRWCLPHRSATGGEHRADGARGPRRGPRRLPVAAHELLRRGPRAARPSTR